MTMMRFFHNRNFTVGFLLSVVIVAMALISFLWTPYPPNRMSAQDRLQGPSVSHPLGTDHYGRDILSRVMKGAVNSIIVGLVTVAIGLSLGVLLGMLAAYYGRFVDEVIMRFADLLFGFPAVLTAILITSILGPSMVNAMLAIGIFYIPVFARLTRAVGMTVYARDFITAARSTGAGEWRVAWRHVMPNIVSPPLLIQGTIQFSVAILAEAGLSYLGLGYPAAPRLLGPHVKRSPNLYGWGTLVGPFSRFGHYVGRVGVQSSWVTGCGICWTRR